MVFTFSVLDRISTYSVRMRENTDHDNSEYGHFLRSACLGKFGWKNHNCQCDRKYFFWANLVPKFKIVCLKWNLVPKLI